MEEHRASSRPAENCASTADEPDQLRADCGSCAGLCCVAPAFTASADFAVDKPAGQACHNLRTDFNCGIHAELRPRGFAGCAVFDCFGAGQLVTQVTFGGKNWRDDPAIATPMFAAFAVMRQLREMQWYLRASTELTASGALRVQIDQMRTHVAHLVHADAETLAAVDAAELRRQVGALLEQVSLRVRADVADPAPDRKGADLIQAKLRNADLRGASLRGAYLLGADLRGANLSRTDLLGADLRAADLRAASLHRSIFLTQPQLDAAGGDAATTIPRSLTRPAHWDAASPG